MKQRSFYWVAGIIALILGFLVLKAFIGAIAFAAVLAYVLYPVHERLRRSLTKFGSATFLTIGLAVLLIAAIIYGLKFFLTEFGRAYIFISKADFTQIFPEQSALAASLKDITRVLFAKLIEYTSNLISAVPQILLSFFVFFATFFYLLKDGKKIALWIKRNTPLPPVKKQKMFKDIGRYIRAFIDVWFVIGILQGIVAVVGFYIFGLPYALLAGLAAAVFSLIPIIGPYLLYIPIGVFLILQNNWFAGLGIIAYGLIIGSILDYGVRPYFAGKWAHVHPLIVLLGIFGGLLLMGPAGVIVGPIILLVVIALLKETSLNFWKRKNET